MLAVYRKVFNVVVKIALWPTAYTPLVQTRDACKVSARSIYKPHSREQQEK
jgi:hypothetical protein